MSKIKKNLLIIDKEGNKIKIDHNCIIGELNIKEDNQNIRIINSYEQATRENKFIKYKKEKENEKEIKDNCEIIINDKLIRFSYFHKFNKKGKYTILYIFKNKITNTNYMFSRCSSLTNINLSNFNTNNVKDMSWMFSWCSSLTNINLSNFNTDNVNKMGNMFSECSSLTNINLSNFNTNNVNNMNFMFAKCSSLTNVNLSNFNTNNVKDLLGMFSECTNLTKNNIITKDKKLLSDLNKLFL